MFALDLLEGSEGIAIEAIRRSPADDRDPQSVESAANTKFEERSKTRERANIAKVFT